MTKLLRRMAGLASAVLFVGLFVGTAPAASAAPASPTALSRAELTQVGPSSLDAALVCTSTVNFSCTCFGYRETSEPIRRLPA